METRHDGTSLNPLPRMRGALGDGVPSRNSVGEHKKDAYRGHTPASNMLPPFGIDKRSGEEPWPFTTALPGWARRAVTPARFFSAVWEVTGELIFVAVDAYCPAGAWRD